MDAFAEQTGLEAEPCGRVVVAAGDDDTGTRLVQGHQRIAQQGVGGAGRSGGIEHVSRDDDDIDRVVANLCGERSENLGESVHGRVAMERPADVPVGGVQDAHTHTVRTPSDIPSEACRGIRSRCGILAPERMPRHHVSAP